MGYMDPAKAQVAEVDLEAVLLDLQQTHSLVSDRLANEVLVAAKAHVAPPVRRDGFVPARVLGFVNALRKCSSRVHVEFAGSPLLQRFMRTPFVVLAFERVEP